MNKKLFFIGFALITSLSLYSSEQPIDYYPEFKDRVPWGGNTKVSKEKANEYLNQLSKRYDGYNQMCAMNNCHDNTTAQQKDVSSSHIPKPEEQMNIAQQKNVASSMIQRPPSSYQRPIDVAEFYKDGRPPRP